MEKIWQFCPKAPQKIFEDNSEKNTFILQLLYNRGLKSEEDFRWFFDLDKAQFYSPFLFEDMEKAVELIIMHIKKGSKIMIYGDYDADGVTSSALLYDIFSLFRAKIDFYLPDRVSEGYGLNKQAIEDIKNDGFELIVTVDNGIRNKEEAEYAKSLGMDIIITDHHALPETREELPNCLIINPADKESKYPFKYLAGVGVAFKLASALIERSKLEEKDKEKLINRNLDLVALGTVADMVSLLGENRLIVKKGLEVLSETKKVGLQELIKISNLSGELSSYNIGFQLGPRLNAASRIKHANSALKLLISNDEDEAKELAEDLNEKNNERQRITEELMSSAESQIDPENLDNIIIVKNSKEDAWNEGVIGLVAGKLSEKYYRPVLVIMKTSEKFIDENGSKKDIYKGSGRSIEGFNLVEALEDNKDILYKYGGHPMAGGFSIVSDNNAFLFMDKMKERANKILDEKSLTPKIKIDLEIDFEDINDLLVEGLEQMAPFGQLNPAPKLASFDLKIIDVVSMGNEGQHIKFRLLDDSGPSMKNFWAISFGGTKKYSELSIGDRVSVVYTLEFNNFNGNKDIQLKVIDIKK
ncbi:MAG: single-stranded-DNA-specific exonuclease RecJ [Patescibacteria group bacterium]